MVERSCEVHGNCLVVSGDFSKDTDTGFDGACQRLLAAGEREMVVDLVGVTHLCSTYVGLLAELCLSAKETGGQLTIRANPRVGRILKDAGLGAAAAIEEAS